jgi:GDP/UDP-N,N'-diacetylbacillosamine 2-epimerase (hydrolysing)
LKKLKASEKYNLHIIVFGTHLSKKHGYTINQIVKDGFNIPEDFQLKTFPKGDSIADITNSIAKTIKVFSKFWSQQKKLPDLVFALGDRFEMIAAVLSAVPFNIKIAHIHGGEETQGAIDNYFRNAITTLSDLHFTATENYKNRVESITGNNSKVFNVGSLSLDNILQIEKKSKVQLSKELDINLSDFILFTFHPETINASKNESYIKVILSALEEIECQVLFTLPNADMSSEKIRCEILNFVSKNPKHYAIENLGTTNYFNAIRKCEFLLGNSSSGIIEAASFGKYVINLGDRQKGRLTNSNVIHVEIDKICILNAIKDVKSLKKYDKSNIYGDGKTANRVVKILDKEI